MPTKQDVLDALSRVSRNMSTQTKKLFTLKTVPTVEDSSNIGFEGLQEVADLYRKVARESRDKEESFLEVEALKDANKCEALLDKWSGKNTKQVDTSELVSDCVQLINSLYPGFAILSGQGRDDKGGLKFEFVLGPSLKHIAKEINDEIDCECPSCTAERARHARGIPQDQLN